MKKTLLTIILALVIPALALAGSCVESQVVASEAQVEIILLCTGDAVDTYTIGNVGKIKLMYLYVVESAPGTGGAAPSAYTLDVKKYDITDGGDSFDYSIVDLANRSTTAVEEVKGSVTLGYYPPATWAKYLALGNLGAANTATVKLTFAK